MVPLHSYLILELIHYGYSFCKKYVVFDAFSESHTGLVRLHPSGESVINFILVGPSLACKYCAMVEGANSDLPQFHGTNIATKIIVRAPKLFQFKTVNSVVEK
jgi:hypothetical protein